MDAIVIRNVEKHFKKSTIRRDYTSFKTELVDWIRGRRKADGSRKIPVLRGIDLAVPRGSTVGLVGRNGSGKSTLLKLITGIYAPTSGTVEVNGRISALLDLGAGFHPDFSGRENILINGIILGMSREEVTRRMTEIIEFSELGEFIEEPVRTYSSGMYMRLAFSVATHVDPDILIVDEILAVGDEHFARKSRAKMDEFKRAGKTILLVTHDLGTLQTWCDQAAWIDGGRIRQFGEPAAVVAAYRRAVAIAEAEGIATGASALSQPGIALPSLEAPQPATAPVARIAELECRDLAGQPLREAGPESALEVAFRVEGSAPAPFRTSVHFIRDGKPAFTSTVPASVLEQTSRSGSRVRLVIARLGFGAGSYDVEVTVTDEAGRDVVSERLGRALLVSDPGGAGSAFVPPHSWSADAVHANGTGEAPGVRAVQ